MRSGIPNRNLATWADADTRLTPDGFYEPGINLPIAIRELGGVESFNGFVGRLSQVGELKKEEGTTEEITESEYLMRGKRIGRNSSDNLRISGSLNDRISQTLIYGKNIKPPIGLEIEKIKTSLIDFSKKGKIGETSNIKKRRKKFRRK